MKEKAYEALINMGYSPEEARETVETASPEDLTLLVPAQPVQKVKPKPVARVKPKPVAKPKSVAIAEPKPVAFDPVAAASGIVKKVEERPTVRYMVRPLYKLKLVDDVDKATFKGIDDEMSSIGGHWFDPLKCWIFESDPTDKL